MPLNKPSCRFSICNHLFQFLRGHSKSRPPGEFPYEPFKTLNHSHISYHGSPASVFSLWWCNPFARSAGKFIGLVLFCFDAKFCKKICVWQHFSSSTRFASFCTAAILKFSQKIGLKKPAIFVKFQQKNCKCRKICKILSNFKNFSLRIW